MGANQSSGSGSGVDREVKTCYYELLGITPSATEEEIKQAYRKKALELHPDRNFGNVEASTKQFADIQSAYEVLSDLQERAWYDTHRDSILRSGDNEGHFEHNTRITTTQEVLQLLSKFNSQIDFSDAPAGFYGALREFFVTLSAEEELACEWEGLFPIQYPSFGYKDDSYEDVVRPFYAMWTSFATKKSFSWKDLYRYSEAPDRKMRRLMEKENKRLRDEGIREFNDAVRSVVAFIRRRDSRVKPTKQSEADRQKVLRDAATRQATRSRIANQEKLAEEAIPDWMKASAPQENDVFELGSGAKTAKEEVECVVCSKTFKSEKQYQAHERSKKHVKAVQQIRHQMHQEDLDLKLAESSVIQEGLEEEATDDFKQMSEDSVDDRLENSDKSSEDDDALSQTFSASKAALESVAKPSEHNQTHPNISESDAASDEDYAPREIIEERLLNDDVKKDRLVNGSGINSSTKDLVEALNSENESARKPKIGKAKEKRAKKAAQKTSLQGQSHMIFTCAECQSRFPSNTRLFDHIKKAGHAQLVSKPVKSGKKR